MHIKVDFVTFYKMYIQEWNKVQIFDFDNDNKCTQDDAPTQKATKANDVGVQVSL